MIKNMFENKNQMMQQGMSMTRPKMYNNRSMGMDME